MSPDVQTAAELRGWGPRGTAGATFAGRLEFEKVSLSFGALEAVRAVSFALEPGEVVCLLGPSGCGKTTLLRIAAGIERPSSGSVKIDGKEVAGSSSFVPPERRSIGLMFQDFALFPHLSILDNVAFGLRDLQRSEALGIARQALNRVGLGGYENSYPHALSGGEQQRVALARAIVPRPQVMLMDEPFSGLDQRLRDSVREETLALLKETRSTCLLVTHDPSEAMGMADRILLMRNGELVQTGTPEELYRRPADIEAALFFSEANVLTGRVRAGKVTTPLGDFAVPGAGEGDIARVAIRPQGLKLTDAEVGIEGYVLDSRFLGEYSRSLILFKGIEDPVVGRFAAAEAPTAGATVNFAIDGHHVLVFPSGRKLPI